MSCIVMVNNLPSQPPCVQDIQHVDKKIKMSVTPIPEEILKDLEYNLIDVKLHQKHVLDRSDFILLSSYLNNREKVEMLMELMRTKTEEDHDNFLEIMEEDYNWIRDKCEIFFQKIRLDALKNNLKPRTAKVQPTDEQVHIIEEQESTEENDKSIPQQKSISSHDSRAILPRSDENINPLHSSIKGSVPNPVKNNENLNQAITPAMMTIVRRNHRVVKRWSTLAHILGMTSIVHTLRMRMVINGEDPDACVLHLLEEWKGAHPKEATLGRLIAALREEGFNDVADELEEIFFE